MKEQKMATETSERKAPPPEPEHLPCPRCDSTNTKFCYYNNYNFSQPRHFCKSCRRYWTHGGTLRDIPIGGGSRKNAKRSRPIISSTTTTSGVASVFSSTHHDFPHFPGAASPQLAPHFATHGGSTPFATDAKMGGSFTSLLNSSPRSGILALGGFGLGLDDGGFGLGRAVWPFTGVVEGGPVNGGGPGVGDNTWQLENGGEVGFVGGGDCFPFPDLAISTQGNVLK